MNTFGREPRGLPPEQQAIRDKCFHPTGTFIEFRREEIEQSIPDRFEEQVRKYPDRIAVKAEGNQLTYDGLNKAANQVANTMLDLEGAENERVAFFLGQGIRAVITILGILKTGRTYVPLDPHFPQARIIDLLEDSQTGLILTDERHFSMVRELVRDESRVLNVSEVPSTASITNPDVCVPPDFPAYIFYTSGSTGEPKGVVDTHRNVLHNIMRYTNSLHICPSDRLTLLHSCGLSATVSSLFSALLNGASVFPLNLQEKSMSNVAYWLAEEEITVYHSVPSVFRQIATGRQTFPKMRLIRLEGDKASPIDIKLFKNHFPPGCILVNGLGATECGLVRQYFIDKNTEILGGIVPIGYPVRDMQLLMLGRDDDGDDGDDDGGRVEEIGIRSRYLAPGYWRNPELTKARFMPVLEEENQRIYRTGDLGRLEADGCLVHLGRGGFGVKIRGYSVEPAEIEKALLSHPSVYEAVVAARGDPRGEQLLVAYLVCLGEKAANVVKIRQFLRGMLPSYMVPSRFVFLDALPKSPGGKIDRRALPPLSSVRPVLEKAFVKARTPVEERLSTIWMEVLGLDRVGIHDHFLELGGDSLLASQVVSRVIKSLKMELPLRSLFETPTIADMAVIIVRNQSKELDQEELDLLLVELDGLTEEQARLSAEEE